ncbi:MAG: cation diffusion facilitator family transporter [Gammaproteobacteria bacterium]|nr:cation diffusion facilitator family transporter [Gammaproteobacteria bacterium]
MSQSNGSLKAIFFALGANLGIALAKSATAWYTTSSAMLAEAIHSFADCTNQLLLLVGMNRANKPVTEQHPLGHGKAIFFYSFIVALLLFSVGGAFAIHEGIDKLTHPHTPNAPWVAVVVLTISIALELASLRAALAEVRRIRGQRTFWRWFKESRQSELIVVTGEDIAALIGLALALVAILATIASGNPLYDALGTIAIGAVLILVAAAIGIEVKSLLIGESADPATVAALQKFLSERPQVAQVYRLITLQFGMQLMLATKVRMREQGSAQKLIDDINQVERELKAAFPEVRWIFFEPDSTD